MKTLFTVDPRLPRMFSTIALELNEIVQGDDFHAILCSHKELFAQSNLDGPTLSAEIKRVLPRLTVSIVPYSYPWYQPVYKRTVNAFVQAPRINKICVNSYRIPFRDDKDWAGTCGHEFTHCIDFLSPYHFGHGDNDPSGDANTATDYVGSIVKMIYVDRRYKRESLAVSQGTHAYEEFSKSVGLQGDLYQNFANQINKPVKKGVYDYGNELGPTAKDSYHVAD